jgi:hypothetical protein
VLCLLLAVGCDQFYEAQIVACLPEPTTTPPGAVEARLLAELAASFALHCQPPEVRYPPATPPEPPETHRSCSTADYTDLEVVSAGRTITVTISKISGVSEPPTFRGLRARTVEILKQAAPGATITVVNDPP